ncbi:hypothetical protein C0J52_22842 [Blattella germanica]|nr:hypothetical protein C0J52_22842 [Blattella germanica]
MFEGEFVIVEFDGHKYPGVVMILPSGVEEGPKVDCMLKMNKGWKLPAKKGMKEDCPTTYMDETYINSSHTTPSSLSDNSMAGLSSPISNSLYMPVESKI